MGIAEEDVDRGIIVRCKWGSCSTAGRVTFDASLLQQHAGFRKRVIVEELLHLRVPNHSKLCKTLLLATRIPLDMNLPTSQDRATVDLDLICRI